ncbi:hypothetical protein [Pseudomonas savastanoi]|nr:hypothetical protein [Pseudomonas savastanoi]
MPTKKKSANATEGELPSIPQELIEQFVKGPMSAEVNRPGFLGDPFV